jgi:hypothetical protein
MPQAVETEEAGGPNSINSTVHKAGVSTSSDPAVRALASESHTQLTASTTKYHQPATSDLTSTTSVDTFASTRSKKDYLDSLVVPPEGELERIAAIQAHREAEHKAEHRRQSREAHRRSQEQSRPLTPQSTSRHESIAQRLDKTAALGQNGENTSLEDLLRAKAASLIQRTYRGYRARREMKGLAVNASTRWVNAIREAQFREAIRPRAREDLEGGLQPLSNGDGQDPSHDRHAIARNNWKRVAIIARRAAIGDEEEDEDEDDTADDLGSDDSEGGDDAVKEHAKQRRQEVKEKKKQEAKTMGLQYFLEMVDLKHRYGSNLRRYHEVWKKSDTHENFFYWLGR